MNASSHVRNTAAAAATDKDGAASDALRTWAHPDMAAIPCCGHVALGIHAYRFAQRAVGRRRVDLPGLWLQITSGERRKCASSAVHVASCRLCSAKDLRLAGKGSKGGAGSLKPLHDQTQI